MLQITLPSQEEFKEGRQGPTQEASPKDPAQGRCQGFS